MDNKKNHNKQTGLRIRTARKRKGINQTELAKLLDKSLRTIQKYESGDIEISIAMINEIAKVLECTSTYLIGYETNNQPISTLADIMDFLFQLDTIKEIGFDVEVKRPPQHDGWQCSVTFNGKDLSTEMNQDLCLFLEQFHDEREEFKSYESSYDSFQKWQEQTLAYYANTKLSKREVEVISNEDRIKKYNTIMNERYGNEES